MSSFIELVLSSYGLRDKKTSMADLSASPGDVCDKVTDKVACNAKLVGDSLSDDALHRDGIRWLWTHISLLRATRADATRSRWETLKHMIKAVPGWMWYPIVILLIIAAIFGLSLLAVVVKSIKNPIIMVKLVVLGLFSSSVVYAYLLLPL